MSENRDETKRKAAAAIKYDAARDKAPRVTARGRGVVAEKIIEKARESGVPVHEDHELAAALAQLPIGEVIPPALYQAVAEVLAFVYRLNQRAQTGKR